MELEKVLAFHSGPALAGIKAANLVSCSYEDTPDLENRLQQLNSKMNPKGIILRPLHRLANRLLVLVYRTKCLEAAIRCPQRKEFLEKLGYPVQEGLEEILSYLEFRVKEAEGFPHEIGIFLGYPLVDVVGFVEHKGKNYKCTGHWKVYGNVQATEALFRKYEKCRNCICHHVERGCSLVDIFGCAA